jgi:hypothetical protein
MGKQIAIDTYNRTWSNAKEEDLENGSAVAMERGTTSIELNQYYSKYGEFKMEITQPFDRAIRTFIAALVEDEEIEKHLSSRRA